MWARASSPVRQRHESPRTSETLAPTLPVCFPADQLQLTALLSASLSGGAAAFGFALVPQLLAFGQGEFNLHSTVLEVHPRGDEGQALLLGLADELADFLLVDQQFAGAQGRVVEDVAVVVRCRCGS